MLRAVVEDFSRVAGVETVSVHENDVRRLGEEVAFRKAARDCAATLVIAPEFDDLLASRSQWALEEGSALLGSPPTTIRQAADKFGLHKRLTAAEIRTPTVCLVESIAARMTELEAARGFVIKPRFGAGCQGIRVVPSPEGLARRLEEIENKSDWLVQARVPGSAASVAFLIGGEQTTPLLAGKQHVIEENDVFRYEGGTAPLSGRLQERAVELGGRALACFRGLRGFVGVDLILGEAGDGSQDYVIEINPRVTTSYVGLRRLCKQNLAAVWWALHQGGRVAEPQWRDRPMRFYADGRVEYA